MEKFKILSNSVVQSIAIYTFCLLNPAQICQFNNLVILIIFASPPHLVVEEKGDITGMLLQALANLKTEFNVQKFFNTLKLKMYLRN